MPSLFKQLSPFFACFISTLEQAFLHLSHPTRYSLTLSIAADFPRSKTQLLAENVLLRQQLITLRVHRQIKKPHFTQSDRLWLVFLASRVQHWKDTLFTLRVKPETLLRWHRQGFRLFWKFKSRNHGDRPRLSIDAINLIQPMAKDNRLWGAERVRGELLKLDIKVTTATIQKYLQQVRPSHAPSQTWLVFLNDQVKDVWTCDLLSVIDLFFHQVNLFFIVELASRRIVHFNVTAHPTDAWVAQ